MPDVGIPPLAVTRLLRIDSAAIAAAAIAAYAIIGGNWWVFALLILAPDLAFVGLLAGPRTGAMIYNVVHSYTLPLAAGAIGYFSGIGWLMPVALIWVTHIGVDRALGYGLKYPDAFDHTHLGLMGKAKKAARIANSG